MSVEKPGRDTKPGDSFALRSHVRRMIALDKASRPRPPTFKFAPVATPSGGTPIRKKRTRVAIGTKRSHESSSGKTLRDNLCEDSGYDVRIEDASSLTAPRRTRFFNTSSAGSCVSTNPLHYHPLATTAASYVDLPIQRLDLLFKSEAFRHAAEPLFDTAHVDSPMNMSSVFPPGSQSKAFFYSLIYSIVQAFNRGRTTLEQLKLRSKSIASLNEVIASGNSSPNMASVATIMVLRGTAYKWEDYATHDLHAKGLATALQATYDCLTPAARRALFWQDLFASILVSAPRFSTYGDPPDPVHWKRSQIYDDSFPRGFLRHCVVLPDGLLDCIRDLLELQAAAASGTDKGTKKHVRIEPLQADIESRLAFQAKAWEVFGVIACATRLAAFIITYTAYMDTWSFSLIPGRIAEQLVRLIEVSMWPTITSSDIRSCCAWCGRSDLLLWLLFIGASAAKDDGGAIEDLRDRYEQVLCSYRARGSTSSRPGVNCACRDQNPKMLSMTLRSALTDFVYPAGWVQRRYKIRMWAEFETWMKTAAPDV